MKLFIIDGIGPFFVDCRQRPINWSKIPFAELERDGAFDWEKFAQVRSQFRRFVERVAALGFNAISLDDVAHLLDCRLYPPPLRAKLGDYRQAFRELFEIASSRGMQVLLTTDVMFFTQELRQTLGRSVSRIGRFLSLGFEQLFADFPELAGIIVRIGESDGQDVGGDFLSELVIRTPAHVRELLRELLPVFEQHQRLLVFRTWTVGSYPIGDLLWNRKTFAKAFEGIDSRQLVISIKYGESDFYQFLPLNKLFFCSKHQKLIELQTRREYEGFGEYPSFIGWDYESYRNQLQSAQNVIGCMIWCQTGGWCKFHRLTFLDDLSFWNELNTEVTLAIFKDRASTEEAVEAFARRRLPGQNWRLLLELLRLSDEVIKELLYIGGFSGRKLFFRRLRVPPLLWVYWDQIIVNHLMRRLLRFYVEDPETTVRQGYWALSKIAVMKDLADRLGLARADLEFYYDTFRVLCLAREYYLRPFSNRLITRLEAEWKEYQQLYPWGYELDACFTPLPLRRRQINSLLHLLFRDKRGYRPFDRLFTVGLLKLFYPLIRGLRAPWIPEFSKTRAMGIDSIFR